MHPLSRGVRSPAKNYPKPQSSGSLEENRCLLKAGLLSFGTLDIGSLLSLCCRRCPVRCGVFSIFSGCCPMDNSSEQPSSPVATTGNVSWVQNHPHWRTAVLEDATWGYFLEQIPSDSQEAHLKKGRA